MQHRPDIKLRPLGPDAEDVRHSMVTKSGEDTGLVLTGEELGAAIDVDGRLLLFVVYGDPYEDSLEIALADTRFALLDSATLGAMGATGTLADVELSPPATVRFAFFGGRPWRLTVHARPRAALPLPTIGYGLARPFAWRRWFDVRPDG